MNATKKELTDEEFIEILDDTYPDTVSVCGYEMYQSNLLHDHDPIAFRQEKLNYEDANINTWICGVCETEFDTEEHANNCCKVDNLIKLLEKLDYSGTDVNLKISLLEYGIVYQESTGHVIICENLEELDDVTDTNSILFDTSNIDIDDIKDAIENMPIGFFNWLGIDITAQNYKDTYYTDTSLVMIIRDVWTYNGYLLGDVSYDMDIDDITRMAIARQFDKGDK